MAIKAGTAAKENQRRRGNVARVFCISNAASLSRFRRLLRQRVNGFVMLMLPRERSAGQDWDLHNLAQQSVKWPERSAWGN